MPRISITRRKEWNDKQLAKKKEKQKIERKTVRKYCFTLRHYKGKIVLHTNDIQEVMKHLLDVPMPFYYYRIQYNGDKHNWPDEIYQINGDSKRILTSKEHYNYALVEEFLVKVAASYKKPTLPKTKYIVLDYKLRKIEYSTNDKLDLIMFLFGRRGNKFRLFIDHYYYPFPREEYVDGMKLMAILNMVTTSKDAWLRLNNKKFNKWNDDILKAIKKLDLDSEVIDENKTAVAPLSRKLTKYYDGSPFENLLEFTPTLQTYGENIDMYIKKQELKDMQEKKEEKREEFDPSSKFRKPKKK